MPSFSGSYGGRGGSPANSLLTDTDSVPYGSYYQPVDAGSGGGNSGGGSGGGSISIIASKSVEIDGILKVDGGDATSSGSGGGSGGSIYIKCYHMDGAGVISARGGKGSGNGGGGSGGRIAIHHSRQSFQGVTVADGGITGESAWADPEGGGKGGPDPLPPEKSQKIQGFLAILIPDLLKITKLPSQHLMLGHHRPASETPFKWRFAGGPIMARL